MLYELTYMEWEKLKEMLPKEEGKQGRPCINLRRTLSAIKRILKTDSYWRALPPDFGNWNSIYRYFCRLQQKGTLEKICSELTKESSMKELSWDSTFVKVHR